MPEALMPDGGGEMEAVKAELAELKAAMAAMRKNAGAILPEVTVELNGAEPEPAGLEIDEIDVTTFSNTEGLKHGLSANFVEEPFAELELELKQEGGEIRLPDSIYTTAMCAGFFADQAVWDEMAAIKDAALHKAAAAAKATADLAAATVTADHSPKDEEEKKKEGDDDDDEEKQAALPEPVSTVGVAAAPAAEEPHMSRCDMCAGFLKNWWLMLVNAFVLLVFHYFLTFTVLWYMFIHGYDSDPFPYDDVTDGAWKEAKNWTMSRRWDSHFVQGTCETDLALRGICASLCECPKLPLPPSAGVSDRRAICSRLLRVL